MKNRHFQELQGAVVALVLLGMAATATASPPQASTGAGTSFESLDRNGDGRLSRSEIPDSMSLLKLRMSTYDSDHDGMLEKAEFTAAEMALHGNEHPTGGKDEAPPDQDSTSSDPTGG